MIHKRTLEALEFAKIRNYLSSFCATEAGKDMALHISPFSDPARARLAFSFYSEATVFYAHPYGNENRPFAVPGFPDLSGLLFSLPENRSGAQANPTKGQANLDIENFWALREMLRAANEAHQAIEIPDAAVKWPHLFQLAVDSPFPGQLSAALNRCISDDCLFRDESSPELYRIRTELRNLHRNCLAKVKDFARQYNMQQYLQDDFMTLSSDRYVLPLKANFKGRMQGIIHDWSQTGETCYFEPIFLVEINNRLQELKHEEREEERKLLLYLSGLLSGQVGQVEASLHLLAFLDFLKAKILFSESLDCHCVTLTQFDEGISLIKARHPLLELSRRQDAKSGTGVRQPVQPVDIILRPGEKILVITGGNAGGKTVCLKTLGLVAAMTLSGLPAPVSAGSHLPWLERMDAFIGDEQSLDDNVSTFTAQIDHLAKAWKHLDNSALVLLDEFGAGTDPAEGSALAQAVLDSLLEMRCLVLAATHFPALKSYALTRPFVRAATMLFDPSTNKPLFRIAYDQVGASQALAIAREHGLPSVIIEKAERHLLQDGGDSSSLMARLNELAAKREEEIDLLRVEKEKYKSRLKSQQEKLEREKSRLHDEIGVKSRELMHAWRENRISAKQALKEMNTLKSALLPDEATPTANSILPAVEKFEPGMEVYHAVFQKKGIITDIDERKNRVRLDMNGVNIWADKKDLRQHSQGQASLRAPSRVLLAAKGAKDPILSLSVDVRGHRASEAIAQVEEYIDKAILEGFSGLEIIHGRGTGALRREIHEFLRSSPAIAKFELASEERGGDGMTIAELK